MARLSAVSVRFPDKSPPFLVHDATRCADEAAIEAASHVGISPVFRHLFSLYDPSETHWVAPSVPLIDTSGDLELRLRYHVQDLRILKDDGAALNAYFWQMRSALFEGVIGKTECRQAVNHSKTLTLVILDVVRHLIDKNQTPEDGQFSFEDFFPRAAGITRLRKFYVRSELDKALKCWWESAKGNAVWTKLQYLERLFELLPNCRCEVYDCLVHSDGSGKSFTTEDGTSRTAAAAQLIIDSFHTLMPGVRCEFSDHSPIHVCAIADICFINERKDTNDRGEVISASLEINRRNLPPFNVRLKNNEDLCDLVSLLVGYYRLMEKWAVNLCPTFVIPSYQFLRKNKCHGPVSASFSYDKLEARRKQRAGCYLIRECRHSYNVFRFDAYNTTNQCFESMELVRIPATGKWKIVEVVEENDEHWFDSLSALISERIRRLAYYQIEYCVPQSEYDDTDLQLCTRHLDTINGNAGGGRVLENGHVTSFSASNSARGNATRPYLYIQRDQLEFDAGNVPLISRHSATLTRYATLLPIQGWFGEIKRLAVVRSIISGTADDMRNYLTKCGEVLCWRSEYLVAAYGMVTDGIVLERFPLGPLDVYLRENSERVDNPDLTDAACCLASALWYLEENNFVHGKIRARNCMVVIHTWERFVIKLGDPGLLSYTAEDVHWIPPECYEDLLFVPKTFSADLWAFATTLWEMYSMGKSPSDEIPLYEAAKAYMNGLRLLAPARAIERIANVLKNCWLPDPESRPSAQACVRDMYQVRYQVYHSRRWNPYDQLQADTSSDQNDLRFAHNPLFSKTNTFVAPPALPPISQVNGGSLSLSKGSVMSRLVKKSFQFLKSSKSTPDVNYAPFTVSSGVTPSEAGTEDTLLPRDDVYSISAEYNNAASSNGNTQLEAPNYIETRQLQMGDILGEGFFGVVRRATLTRYQDGNLVQTNVAVKLIKPGMSELTARSRQDLEREIEIMKGLSHSNIVRIEGLVVDDSDPMLVMELLLEGTLLSYLKSNARGLNHDELLKYAYDVASGMEYLASRDIVHRDLAARNILVESKTRVKISDFGLAQFVRSDYYQIQSTERCLPYKWYAPESIMYGKFSTKSDVWSFGIFLWELFTYGEDPILESDQRKLAIALENGERLPMPKKCPADMWCLMNSCWQYTSINRPAFADCFRLLNELNVYDEEQRQQQQQRNEEDDASLSNGEDDVPSVVV